MRYAGRLTPPSFEMMWPTLLEGERPAWLVLLRHKRGAEHRPLPQKADLGEGAAKQRAELRPR